MILEKPNSKKKSLWMRLLVGAILIAVASILFKFTPLAAWLKPQNLRLLKEQAGVFAPLGFIAIYAIATIFAVPGTILTLSGGALFEPVFGTLWTVIGATLGATGAFLIARFIAGDWARLQFEKGDILPKLRQGIEQDGFWFVLSLRLSPLFPFIAINYLLGLTPLPLPAYVLATLIGIIPGSFAYTWLGSAGLAAATGGAPWQLLGALGVLAVISLLPILVKWFKRRRTDT
jgi:uncharacterized membrane protein YdjX (TVP38/TMEM64 family)